MEHAESLFLETLRDLEARLASRDDYDVLGISALIRKLLIDASPLVDQVNRSYRFRILFEVTQPAIPVTRPSTVLISMQDAIDPESFPSVFSRRTVNRDQLLEYPLVVVRGHIYTLREIVLFEANVMGGVHAGTPKAEKERALARINSHVAIQGARVSLRQLRAIGRIVLRGLQPLRTRVEESRRA